MSPLLKKALSLLTRRDYSEQELRQKLTQFSLAQHRLNSTDDIESEVAQESGIDSLELARVIDYCYHYNWLNDSEYAGKYIRARSEKGYGFRRIALELKQKGLSPVVIEEARQQNPIDYSAHITKIIGKKFRHEERKDWTTCRKIAHYLASRGFSRDEIMDVLNEDFSDI